MAAFAERRVLSDVEIHWKDTCTWSCTTKRCLTMVAQRRGKRRSTARRLRMDEPQATVAAQSDTAGMTTYVRVPQRHKEVQARLIPAIRPRARRSGASSEDTIRVQPSIVVYRRSAQSAPLHRLFTHGAITCCSQLHVSCSLTAGQDGEGGARYPADSNGSGDRLSRSVGSVWKRL